MNLTPRKHGLEGSLVHPEIISRGGLNVLVPGQFLDEHDVGAVVQQAGAKRVPQHVRSQALGNARKPPEPFESLGHVSPAEPPRYPASSDEQRRTGISPEC
jgi:hypothetical protein